MENKLNLLHSMNKRSFSYVKDNNFVYNEKCIRIKTEIKTFPLKFGILNCFEMYLNVNGINCQEEYMSRCN